MPKNAVKEIKIYSNNKINLILIKNLKIKNEIKYIKIIYYHIYKLIKDKKLATINWIAD